MNYFDKLKEIVLANSYAKTYAEATTEWVTSYYDTCDSDVCLCGKCGLQHRYEITNVKTGKILFPIGSECINKFNNEKMSSDALALKEIATYRTNFLNGEPALASLHPNLVNYCYGLDAFEDEKDYQFALSLSRKRSLPNLSEKQTRKINFLMDKMENAILFDSSFYNNEREKEKARQQKEDFLKNVGKSIKIKEIPPLVMIYLPTEIFEKEEHKFFVLSIYRKLQRGNVQDITEKQKKFFDFLMINKVFPYFKNSLLINN